LGLLAGSVAALALRRDRTRARRAAVQVALGSAAAACALIAAAAANRLPPSPPQPSDRPLREPAPGDTSSLACRSCHPGQYASWHASYHRTMTQTATDRAVVGDFGDARAAWGSDRFRMFERDGQYFGQIASVRDGRAHSETLRFEQTTGSHHMQIYWVASGAARTLQSFPLVWLRSQQRWIPRTAAFVTPPSEHPAPSSVWNYTCIGCHTTRPRPRIGEDGSADSHVTELGIACEACHGPGREHVESHRSPLHRYLAHFSSEPDRAIVNPSRLS